MFTVLLLVFFLVMVIQTMQKDGIKSGDDGGITQRQDFKSSPLALLFHGLDQKTLRGLGTAGTSNEAGRPAKDAKSMVVRFERSEKGWNFTG